MMMLFSHWQAAIIVKQAGQLTLPIIVILVHRDEYIVSALQLDNCPDLIRGQVIANGTGLSTAISFLNLAEALQSTITACEGPDVVKSEKLFMNYQFYTEDLVHIVFCYGKIYESRAYCAR
ncbi:hypothetical protein GQQ15_05250 [Pantoea agglomerans]|jgi:hypothetical protein|nr:hypothetical protein [Pantoea agglomerans]NEH06823.1 hypothetical protein [Pantoea agglomerans]